MEQFNADQVIERDIERLSREVGAIKEKHGAEKIGGQELLKESLRAFGTVPSPVPVSPAGDEDNLLPTYLKGMPAEIKLQVEKLLDVVMHKGIEEALQQAAQQSPFLLDALHDALVDKLYPKLKERGILS